MTITIDQDSAPLDAVADTLGDAITIAHAKLAPFNRVVVRVEMDGQELDGQQMSDAKFLSAQGRNLRFISATRQELAARMIAKIAALVEALSLQHPAIAKELEAGNTTSALNDLGRCLAQWQQVQEAFGGTLQLLNIKLKDLRIGEIPAEQKINAFLTQLHEVKQALQDGDMVLLADILQYEMEGAIAIWVRLLETVMSIADPTYSQF